MQSIAKDNDSCMSFKTMLIVLRKWKELTAPQVRQ